MHESSEKVSTQICGKISETPCNLGKMGSAEDCLAVSWYSIRVKGVSEVGAAIGINGDPRHENCKRSVCSQ